MAFQKHYHIELQGQSPLIMHKDNLSFGEKVKAWQKDPANKTLSVAGDDRTPAWTWLGYSYFDKDEGKFVMDSDCIMTCLREGGAKVSTGKSKETFKRYTQSGLTLDKFYANLYVNGKQIPTQPFLDLANSEKANVFSEYEELAEKYGFELFVKRAKIGMAKHIRVRPYFRNWTLAFDLTVFDEEVSGLTKEALELIFKQAGSLVGIGDWRPGSPKSSGTYGRFTATITEIN